MSQTKSSLRERQDVTKGKRDWLLGTGRTKRFRYTHGTFSHRLTTSRQRTLSLASSVVISEYVYKLIYLIPSAVSTSASQPVDYLDMKKLPSRSIYVERSLWLFFTPKSPLKGLPTYKNRKFARGLPLCASTRGWEKPLQSVSIATKKKSCRCHTYSALLLPISQMHQPTEEV